MSKHLFNLEVEVDDAALAEHNAMVASSVDEKRTPISLPDDPQDWGDNDLQTAIEEEIATFVIKSSEELS